MESYDIRRISPMGKGRYRIELEDTFPFVLYKGELLKYGLEEEGQISSDVYEEIRSMLLRRCKMRAMHLLEKQDRTEANVRQKLKDNQYPEDLIEETIAYLYSFHYLDDERFIRNYISYYGQTKSRTQILMALQQKGVDKEAALKGFEELEEEEEGVRFLPDEEKIKQILQKKHFVYEQADEKEKARIFRHLVGKGFRTEDILRSMKQN